MARPSRLAARLLGVLLAGCSLLDFFEAPPTACESGGPCGDGDSDGDVDADSDSDVDADSDSDSDSDGDADSDSDSDSDGDADSDSDGDADAGRDTGTDAGRDSGVVEPSCGDGVVNPERGESCDPPNETDCRGDCVYLGQQCGSADECGSDHCVDGVCCESACVDLPCQRCDLYSASGAGVCGYVASPAQDPDGDCQAALPPNPGSCRTGSCSGSGYSCGALAEGEQGQPACKRCPGGSEDPVDVANLSVDIEGNELCDDPCMTCSGNGSCIGQAPGWDRFDRCEEPLSCCDGSGTCGASGTCTGGWSNIYLDTQSCEDCTDEWCWSRGHCGSRDCPLLEGQPWNPEGYYCQCFVRDTCPG